MKWLVSIATSFAFALVISSCGKKTEKSEGEKSDPKAETQKKTPTPPPPPPADPLPTEADFEEDAESQITEENLESELASLEKAMADGLD